MSQLMSRESEAKMAERAKRLLEIKKRFFRRDVVESKVGGMFPISIVAEVLQILGEYQAHSESHAARVHLAALKLSDGALEKLRIQINAATQDFRDVINPAENPGIFSMRMGAWAALSDNEKEKLSNEDHDQYLNWIQEA